MGIISGLTTSFKSEILTGLHDLSNDMIKVALLLPTAKVGPDATAYTPSTEISFTPGYTAGGQLLTGFSLTTSGTDVLVSWDNPVWTLTASTTLVGGAIIYNASKSNRSIMVLNFGLGRAATGTWTLKFPSPPPTSAVIRIS